MECADAIGDMVQDADLVVVVVSLQTSQLQGQDNMPSNETAAKRFLCVNIVCLPTVVMFPRTCSVLLGNVDALVVV